MADFQLPPGFEFEDEVAPAPAGSPLGEREAARRRPEPVIPPLTRKERKTAQKNVQKALDRSAETATAAGGLIGIVREGRDALEAIPEEGFSLVRPGFLGNFRLQIGKAAELLGVDIENIEDAEVLDRIATQSLKEFFEATKGAISDKEVKLFQGATVGLKTSVEGNRRIFDLIEAGSRRLIERDKFLTEYARVNGTLGGSEKAWFNFKNENELFTRNLGIVEENLGNWSPYLDPNFTKKGKQTERPVERPVERPAEISREDALRILRERGLIE